MTKASINGVDYTLKPFTKANLDSFIAVEAAAQEELKDGTLADKIFDYYDIILNEIIYEDVSEVDWTLCDGNEIENVVMSFVPPSFRIMASLSGFSG